MALELSRKWQSTGRLEYPEILSISGQELPVSPSGRFRYIGRRALTMQRVCSLQ